MTTAREYKEGQRRIRKLRRQKPKNNNQFLWFVVGIIVFVGLIIVQSSRNRSPENLLPATSDKISQ